MRRLIPPEYDVDEERRRQRASRAARAQRLKRKRAVRDPLATAVGVRDRLGGEAVPSCAPEDVDAQRRMTFSGLARYTRGVIAEPQSSRSRVQALLLLLESKAGEIGDRRLAGRVVQNLRQSAESGLRAAQARTVPVRLGWRLLPSGNAGRTEALSLLRSLRRGHPSRRFDPSRINFAYELKPPADHVYTGTGPGDGYFAFVFGGGTAALLECPIEGNAAYIFGEPWRTLSKLTKAELLDEYRGEVVRVVHGIGDSWKKRIKSALKAVLKKQARQRERGRLR